MLMLNGTPKAECSFYFPATDTLQTEALLVASVAAGSFQARPRGQLVGWKKRWQIHASILRASAAEVRRLQKIDTEPDETDCHFCIKAHRKALAALLSCTS